MKAPRMYEMYGIIVKKLTSEIFHKSVCDEEEVSQITYQLNAVDVILIPVTILRLQTTTTGLEKAILDMV